MLNQDKPKKVSEKQSIVNDETLKESKNPQEDDFKLADPQERENT